MTCGNIYPEWRTSDDDSGESVNSCRNYVADNDNFDECIDRAVADRVRQQQFVKDDEEIL